MKVEKKCYVNGKEARCIIDTKAERIIKYDGEVITDWSEVPYYICNEKDEAVDSFEDGWNTIINGYEVYNYGNFEISRKVDAICTVTFSDYE